MFFYKNGMVRFGCHPLISDPKINSSSIEINPQKSGLKRNIEFEENKIEIMHSSIGVGCEGILQRVSRPKLSNQKL